MSRRNCHIKKTQMTLRERKKDVERKRNNFVTDEMKRSRGKSGIRSLIGEKPTNGIISCGRLGGQLFLQAMLGNALIPQSTKRESVSWLRLEAPVALTLALPQRTPFKLYRMSHISGNICEKMYDSFILLVTFRFMSYAFVPCQQIGVLETFCVSCIRLLQLSINFGHFSYLFSCLLCTYFYMYSCLYIHLFVYLKIHLPTHPFISPPSIHSFTHIDISTSYDMSTPFSTHCYIKQHECEIVGGQYRIVVSGSPI